MFNHGIRMILIIEPKVPPFLPLQQGNLGARPDTLKNLGSRPPFYGVFVSDDLALKITPVRLNPRTAIIERIGHNTDRASPRHLAGAPIAFQKVSIPRMDEIKLSDELTEVPSFTAVTVLSER